MVSIAACVLSWCCSVVLHCTLLHSIVLNFNISPNVQYFPILICQKWTKVMFCGNQVPTKVTIKWIENLSKLLKPSKPP